MPDLDSDIAMLILKQLQQELTPEEDERLQQWMAQSDSNRQLIESLSDEHNLDKQVQEFFAFRRLAEGGRKEVNVVEAPAGKKTWYRYAAAAAVLILLSVAGYLVFKPTSQQVSKTENNQKPSISNIPPGRDGAILTLGDGKQILLDSAVNGQLAVQGQTTITRKDGQISYRASDQQQGKVEFNTTSTPRGRQYKLQLSDGTAIWLNAASSVTYPTLFTGPKREVSITGEVYLEVAPNKSKPFVVHVANNNTNIEVLGTRFTVNAYNDEPYMKTTLLAGSIKLTAQVQGKNTNTILRPGQQTRVSHENLEVIKEANTEEAVAFINGFFYFNKADIKTVMRQLEKWYDIQVNFAQPVSNKTFDGEIQRSLALPVVLKMLERSGVQFSMEGNRVQVK